MTHDTCNMAVANATNLRSLYSLQAVLNTRTRYPWFVVVSHSLYSACKFRSERRAADPAYAPGGGVASMAVAFVCYGFGGTILTDALTGHVVAVPIHPRCFPVFMACWYLVWYTPFDLVYRFAWEQKRGPLRLLMVLGEAIDSAMTPLGRITKLGKRDGVVRSVGSSG